MKKYLICMVLITSGLMQGCGLGGSTKPVIAFSIKAEYKDYYAIILKIEKFALKENLKASGPRQKEFLNALNNGVVLKQPNMFSSMPDKFNIIFTDDRPVSISIWIDDMRDDKGLTIYLHVYDEPDECGVCQRFRTEIVDVLAKEYILAPPPD